MHDQGEAGAQAGRDISDESRDYILALTDSGWGVWDKGDASGEPVALFGPDDLGYDLASDSFEELTRTARVRRGPWLGPLRWVALISGCVWIGLNGIMQVRYAAGATAAFNSEKAAQAFLWVQGLSGIAYSVFIVAVGAYVVLWLRSRTSP